MDIFDTYFDESLLSNKERAEVKKIVGSYNGLDMDLFVKRVGGLERVEEMKRINNVMDDLYVVNGVVHKKPKTLNETKENLEEWKQGFMEGFEEAYKRFNANNNQ